MIGRCQGRHRVFVAPHRVGVGNGDGEGRASRGWEGYGGKVWTCGLRGKVRQVE